MNDFRNLACEVFGVLVNKCLVQLVKLLKTALQIGQPCPGFRKLRGQCFGADARGLRPQDLDGVLLPGDFMLQPGHPVRQP